MGSFDDFNAMADIAKKYNMWFHIDGCWGGSLCFSETLKEKLFKGMERSDSMSINPHKGS